MQRLRLCQDLRQELMNLIALNLGHAVNSSDISIKDPHPLECMEGALGSNSEKDCLSLWVVFTKLI